jgi:hypothetical protein
VNAVNAAGDSFRYLRTNSENPRGPSIVAIPLYIDTIYLSMYVW